EALKNEQLEQLEALTKHAKHSLSAERRAAVLKTARSEKSIVVSITEFDRDPWALNVLNGTIDLRTGELRQHNRADLITRLAPGEYGPATPSGVWITFLERTIPDETVRAYAQRLAGYTLTGVANEKVAVIIYGPKNSGKGTFQDALACMLGDYAIACSIDLLEK